MRRCTYFRPDLWAKPSTDIRSRTLQIATVLASLLLLVACSAPKASKGLMDVPCTTLAAEGLNEHISQSKTPSEWSDLMTALFHVTPDSQTEVRKMNGVNRIEISYTLQVEDKKIHVQTQNRILTGIRLSFRDPLSRPALGRVIDCFGPPSDYSILYTSAPDAFRPRFIMDFYFADQGIHLYTEEIAPKRSSGDDSSLPSQPAQTTTAIRWIDWLKPGDYRSLDWQLHTEIESRQDPMDQQAFWQLQARYYEHVAHWPGSIDQLTVTMDDTD